MSKLGSSVKLFKVHICQVPHLNEVCKVEVNKPSGRSMRHRDRPLYNTVNVTSCSSVLAIRSDEGVMIAADTLVSYGSEKAFPEADRDHDHPDQLNSKMLTSWLSNEMYELRQERIPLSFDMVVGGIGLPLVCQVIKKVMSVLYYRYCGGHNRYLLGICSRDSCSVEGPLKVDEKCGFAAIACDY